MFPPFMKVNQDVYHKLLNDYLPKILQIKSAQLFQQDGASAHTTMTDTKWL